MAAGTGLNFGGLPIGEAGNGDGNGTPNFQRGDLKNEVAATQCRKNGGRWDGSKCHYDEVPANGDEDIKGQMHRDSQSADADAKDEETKVAANIAADRMATPVSKGGTTGTTAFMGQKVVTKATAQPAQTTKAKGERDVGTARGPGGYDIPDAIGSGTGIPTTKSRAGVTTRAKGEGRATGEDQIDFGPDGPSAQDPGGGKLEQGAGGGTVDPDRDKNDPSTWEYEGEDKGEEEVATDCQGQLDRSLQAAGNNIAQQNEAMTQFRACQELQRDPEDAARKSAGRAIAAGRVQAGRGGMGASGAMLATEAQIQQEAEERARESMFGRQMKAGQVSQNLDMRREDHQRKMYAQLADFLETGSQYLDPETLNQFAQCMRTNDLDCLEEIYFKVKDAEEKEDADAYTGESGTYGGEKSHIAPVGMELKRTGYTGKESEEEGGGVQEGYLSAHQGAAANRDADPMDHVLAGGTYDSPDATDALQSATLVDNGMWFSDADFYDDSNYENDPVYVVCMQESEIGTSNEARAWRNNNGWESAAHSSVDGKRRILFEHQGKFYIHDDTACGARGR